MKVPRIAILVDTATGWGRRTIRGALDYATASGPWDIRIEPGGREDAMRLKSGQIDGVIARVASQEMADELLDLNLPVVNISGLELENCPFPRVAVDTRVAAALAKSHLTTRGLQHFAYVGPVETSYVHQHEAAFREVVESTGISCFTYNPNSSDESGLISWLRELPKPVGIYTWGFQIGRDLISACRIADLRVPHEIAVLGGDFDELLSDACHPPLSGVVTPSRQIGYRAAHILHDMIRGELAPTKAVLIGPEKIEERLSTDVLAIDDPQIRKAIIYLRENALRPIQVDDILREVPMARRLLERKFSQHLGHSPSKEIRRLRINHARELLQKTDLPMQEVAEACGYGTYNYLGTIFKKETGKSPNEYRRSLRGK